MCNRPGDDRAAQEARQKTEALIITGAAPDSKQFATLRARCALAGVTLIESVDDRGRYTYIASRWNLTRELPDLDAVEAWLSRVIGDRS